MRLNASPTRGVIQDITSDLEVKIADNYASGLETPTCPSWSLICPKAQVDLSL